MNGITDIGNTSIRLKVTANKMDALKLEVSRFFLSAQYLVSDLNIAFVPNNVCICAIRVVTGVHQSLLKVRFHHQMFATNLMTNSLTKLPYEQMSHIFVWFVSQKFVANQIGLLKLTKATLRAGLS
jgi:hypothetical protein